MEYKLHWAVTPSSEDKPDVSEEHIARVFSLKMEVTSSSGTSATLPPTRLYNPEDRTHCSHHRESLKPNKPLDTRGNRISCSLHKIHVS
jgi:hypothetical protein